MDLPLGHEGEIVARGPELFLGYSDPELDKDCFMEGGWFKTGDIGKIDEEGFITITDRKKDIIIRGGENISSKEVEEILISHPFISDAAVVSMPDIKYGEKVCAFVTLREPLEIELEDIIAHFKRAGVARCKIPERLKIVREFPRTPSGKIKKQELRKSLIDAL